MKQKICTKSCDEISIAIPKIVDGKKIKSTSRIQVFYKIDEDNKKVVIYAVVDQRQDYLNIIKGL